MAPVALIVGVAVQTIVTALLGLSLGAHDVLLLLAVGTAACAVLGLLAGRRSSRGRVAVPRAGHRRMLLRLNIWTAAAFFAFFLGVGAAEASTVVAVELGVTPLAVSVWSALRRRRGSGEHAIAARQWALAALLAGVGLTMAGVVSTATAQPSSTLMGAALGVMAGIATAGVVVTARDLAEAGVGVARVMGHRFHLTYVLAGLGLLVMSAGAGAPPRVGLIALAALGALVVPLFCLQYAIARLAPITVTAALAMSPAATLLTELLLGQAVAPAALVLSLLIVPCSVALIYAERHQRSDRSAPPPIPPTSPRPPEETLAITTCGAHQ